MAKIKIGILDFEKIGATPASRKEGAGINPTKIFINEIKKAGHIPVVYKAEKCQMFFDNKKATILYKNKRIKGCDILLPRLDFSTNIDLEISIIKQFQLMGIPVLNEYMPISAAKNKLRTLQLLTKAKLPVPNTIIVRKFDYLDDSIKRIGGYPVIIKSAFGSYGKQVAIIESRRSLLSALDVIWRQDTSIILIQEYVAESEGSDIRVFVVGDKVVAAMKRTAVAGDFRSNLSLGGVGSKTSITEQEEKLALKASKTLGLHISGVDILRTNNGPVVMEINANPGVFGITSVTGINVVEKIVKYAEQYLNNLNDKG